MKLSQTRIAIVLAILVATSSGCGVINRIRSKNQLNEAARAYHEGRFPEAELHEERLPPWILIKDRPDVYRSHDSRSISPGRADSGEYRQGPGGNHGLQADPREEPKERRSLQGHCLSLRCDQRRRQTDTMDSPTASDETEPEKRAEAYVVLASKHWDCSFKITELPTNKKQL